MSLKEKFYDYLFATDQSRISACLLRGGRGRLTILECLDNAVSMNGQSP